jgi:antitoxin VapB
MNTAKIFQNGRSQAVRLPKEFQFDTDEVYVNKVGEMVILFPRDKGWDVLAKSLEHFTDDFMAERDQPAENQKRKTL